MADVMTVDEICDLVDNHLSYKEGWTIDAYNYGTYAHITYTARVDNSSPANVDPRSWVITDGGWDIRPGTKEQVMRAMLDGLVKAETHETREFLRFDGVAPFHPHRADGDRLYETGKTSEHVTKTKPASDPFEVVGSLSYDPGTDSLYKGTETIPVIDWGEDDTMGNTYPELDMRDEY